MNLFVTADLHFYHKRMAYQWREYPSVEDMNDDLIELWNDTAGLRDEIYVLGDFSFGTRAQTEEIFRQLNGKKYLIRGNHDGSQTTKLGWENQWDIRRLKYDGKSLYLCHYPMLTWPNAHHGTLHLHGHCHGNLQATQSTRMDVGIDATGVIMMPVDEVIEKMESFQYDKIDHHDRDYND